jgi:2''-5'' RNA ligase
MPRLFTGIELPPSIKDRLARLKAPLPGARWVEPENMHVTLRFAGDINNLAASEFADALAQINVNAFEICFSGLGAFGGHDPHNLYARIESSPSLDALQRANERAARSAGLAPEGRSFKPHVTLARLRHSNPEAVARFLGRHGGFRSKPFIVEQFVLFSSRPNTGGGPYVAEAVFPHGGVYSGLEWGGPDASNP